MRRVFSLGLLAAVTTFLGVLLSGLVLPERQSEVVVKPATTTSPFYSDSIAPRKLLQTPLRLSFSGASLNDALRGVGGQLPVRAAIEVDEIALRSLELAAPTRIDLQAAERPASEWLRRIMRQADPDGRLRLTFTVNPDRTLSFLVTTQQAADDRFLFVVPNRFLAAPPPARNAVERFQPRRTTFAEALQYFAGRMGAHVRIDREALSSHGVWSERRIVLPADFVSPESGLKEVLAQAGGELGLRIDVDELGRRTVLVTDRRLLMPDGPSYQQLVRSRPFTGVWELPTREPAQMTFGERFRRPIDDAPVDLPLAEALQRAVAVVKIPLVVRSEDFDAANISPDTIVRYEPGGREVRAVLYDLLTQADGQKSQRLIYCYQQRPDGKMTLIITTRDAAERAGRSIPFDFSLVSDDD